MNIARVNIVYASLLMDFLFLAKHDVHFTVGIASLELVEFLRLIQFEVEVVVILKEGGTVQLRPVYCHLHGGVVERTRVVQ